jgi:hypothetical protein
VTGVAHAPLLDDGQRRVQELGESSRPLGEAEVGHDHRIFDALLDEVVAEQVHGRQLIDGDVEEALDLALVKVHGQHAVGAGDADHVRDEACRDGYPGLVLLVRTAVGVVGHHSRDASGAGTLEGVDHDEQLHDRLLDGRAGGLHQEHVALTDVVQDAHEDVLVGELEDLATPQRRTQVTTDLAGQRRVGVARVDGGLLGLSTRIA